MLIKEIKIPGSKSISNRLLILAAMCNSEIEISNIAESSDTKYLLECLEKLGAKIVKKENSIIISEQKNLFQKKAAELYTHNAGTTTRFLTAFCTLLEREIKISGDKRMSERPIAPLIEMLSSLGADVKSKTGCPPISIRQQKPKGGKCQMPGDISSQYLSAILMIASQLENLTEIEIRGELCSKPYIEITLKLLEEFGVKVENHGYKKFVIKPCLLKNCAKFIIENDASSASYIAAIAAINPAHQFVLENITSKSIQGDIAFIELLKKMGCKIDSSTNTFIQGPKQLKSLGEIDMNHIPDLVMTFSVLAPFSHVDENDVTRIVNIENLRIKECDRLLALNNELTKLGVTVKTGKDYIEIKGKYKITEKTLIKTYEDHRIALSFGVLKTKFDHLIEIEDPECVIKSYPNFWQELKKISDQLS